MLCMGVGVLYMWTRMGITREVNNYSVGDKVLILGSEGTVIDILEGPTELVVSSSRGISKARPHVSSKTLRPVSLDAGIKAFLVAIVLSEWLDSNSIF